ncbi:MAG: polyprenyl synthetase family protein [Gallionella sp.]|nr:MAG: polyprenyl synthetase family protein [Gallionella sp.]
MQRSYKWVENTLNEYMQMTKQVMLDYFPDKEPQHYLYDLVSSYPNRTGKGLRPGLCIATCRAFGGSISSVLRSAAAIELFHNAFLIHDDVEDGSEFRRGLPTMHKEYGVGIAINVGDAMNVLSIRPLMDNLDRLGSTLTWLVFAEIEHMVRESVEGQAMELGWVRDNVCSLAEADYLRMILKKTCWYTCMHPCRIGALIGSGGSADLDSFNRFAYYMGAAFQIQDDALNLEGEHERYGKEISGDIFEGKRTLMLIHLLNNCTAAEHEYIREFLSRPREQRSMEQVGQVHDLMVKYNSIRSARSTARHLAGAAMREFHLAYGKLPDSDDKRLIENIILYMIERDI